MKLELTEDQIVKFCQQLDQAERGVRDAEYRLRSIRMWLRSQVSSERQPQCGYFGDPIAPMPDSGQDRRRM